MQVAKWIAIHASFVVLMVLAVASTASASDITLSITDPNAALSGFAGPYATVTVHLINSTQAQVTVASNFTASTSYLMGAAQGVDLNINGTIDGAAFVISTPSTMPGFGIPFPSLGNTPQNVAGFGDFDFVLDFFDGFGQAATEMVFTLTLISGSSITWSSAADVLVPNAKGFEAAVHAFACDNSAGTGCLSPFAGGAALATGFAANGTAPPPPTPEPATITLMGTFLLAAYHALRRKA